MKALCILLAATSTLAHAQTVTFEIIEGIYPLDISADGSAIAGNNFGFSAVRWTRDTGVVDLGRSTTAALGVGAGSPDISDDGTRVSATILSDNGLFATQGIWTEGTGWEDFMPPTPPDGGVIDQSLGSAWGLSGDGTHVVGLYWRPGNFATGGAHASMATTPGNVIDLGSGGGNSRANHANFDGSVIVGWDENPFGQWQPTVWENGVKSNLSTFDAFTAADHVNPDGTIIGGYGYDPVFTYLPAVLWHKTPTGWDEQVLGVLPGTTGPQGLVTVRSMTPDGSIVVGWNKFNNFGTTGFIWTAETGMEDIVDWLANRGIGLPKDFLLLDLTGISADGNIMCGIGVNPNNAQPRGFIITITPDCPVDYAEPFGTLNFFDLGAFLTLFNAQDPAADLAAPADVWNFFDLGEFLNQFNTGCP